MGCMYIYIYIYRPQKGSWMTTADPVSVQKTDPEETPGKKVIDVCFP